MYLGRVFPSVFSGQHTVNSTTTRCITAAIVISALADVVVINGVEATYATIITPTSITVEQGSAILISTPPIVSIDGEGASGAFRYEEDFLLVYHSFHQHTKELALTLIYTEARLCSPMMFHRMPYTCVLCSTH